MKTKPLEEVKSLLVKAFAEIDRETQEKAVTPARMQDIRIIVDEAIINIKDSYENLNEGLKGKKISAQTPSERTKLKKAKKLYTIITKKDLTKTEAKIIQEEISIFAGLVQHQVDAKKSVVSKLRASWGTRFDTSTIEKTYAIAIKNLNSNPKWACILEKSYLSHNAIDTIQLYVNELLLGMSSSEKKSPREQFVQRSIETIA